MTLKGTSLYSAPPGAVPIALLFLLISFQAVASPGPGAGGRRDLPSIWVPLFERLVHDGQDPAYLKALFLSPSVRFDPRVMPRKLTHREAELNYARFLRPERIARARRYLEENRELLSRIEAAYGVPKEIKVAILLVETDLGNYLGGGLAFNILASMAVATDMDRVKEWLPRDLLQGPDAQALKRRLREKSSWAYGELKAFLVYTRLNHLDPLKIKGSIFGAIGLCQFMPSNALRYGIDYDGDGRVDLFEKADALASMANYLKAHGWRPGLEAREQVKVLMSYNCSRPYAETVIKVAERLSKGG